MRVQKFFDDFTYNSITGGISNNRGFRVESEKRLYPDLAIWKHEELIAVGSVKIYVTNGVGEIEGELTKLKSLKSRFKIYEGY